MGSEKKIYDFADRLVRRFLELFLFCAIFYAIMILAGLSSDDWKSSDQFLFRHWPFLILLVPAIGVAWEIVFPGNAAEHADSPEQVQESCERIELPEMKRPTSIIELPEEKKPTSIIAVVLIIGWIFLTSTFAVIYSSMGVVAASADGIPFMAFIMPAWAFGAAGTFNYFLLRKNHPIAARRNVILFLILFVLGGLCSVIIVFDK